MYLLPLLLYMDFGGIPAHDYATEHCFATKSASNLKPFNRICHNGPLVDAEVKCLQRYFDTKPCTWLMHRDDAESAQVVQRHGFQKHPVVYCAMQCNISEYTSMPYDDSIVIQKVHDDSMMQEWLAIVSASFPYYYAQELSLAMDALLQKAGNHSALYIGFYNTIPCAAALMMYHADTVTLHMIGTLPAYRRKGIGTAIMSVCLSDAAQKSCHTALLLASQAGKSLYERLGFKEYAQYTIYWYDPNQIG